MLAFRRAVEAREFDTVGELLTENVVLHSPIAFRPYQGREPVARIIKLVASILEDFAFQREIGTDSNDDHALIFGARVGDLSIQGCDFLHTTTDGLIDELTVMLRPLRAVQAFEERMRANFEAAVAPLSNTSETFRRNGLAERATREAAEVPESSPKRRGSPHPLR